MNIVEAIKKAQEKKDGCIYRECWGSYCHIEPTPSPLGCLVINNLCGTIKQGWQPNIDDLTADDWVSI